MFTTPRSPSAPRSESPPRRALSVGVGQPKAGLRHRSLELAARVTVRLGGMVCLGVLPAWCRAAACDSSGDWPPVVCLSGSRLRFARLAEFALAPCGRYDPRLESRRLAAERGGTLLGSLAEVLPAAARRFGDKRALVVGDPRSRSRTSTYCRAPSRRAL